MIRRCCFFIFIMLMPGFLLAKDIRLICSADLSLRQNKRSYSSDFTETNFGKAEVLPFHGIHYLGGPNEIGHFIVLNFDLSPIKMKTPGKFTLYLKGENDISDLSIVSVSTVSTPWIEGTGTGENTKTNGDGASAHWASYNKRRWIQSDPQSELIDVGFGFGNSIWEPVRVRHEENGWIAIDIPQKVSTALSVGASYGIALSDDKGQLNIAYMLYSRESSGNEPYIIVKDAINSVQDAPNSISSVKADAAIDFATLQTGAIRIGFDAPEGNAIAYHVMVESDGTSQSVPRYAIPFPQSAGTRQEMEVTGLSPGKEYTFLLSAVNSGGLQSKPVRIRAKASPAIALPEPLSIKKKDIIPGGPLSAGNGIKIWAYDADCKANPLNGNLLEEVGANKYGGAPKGVYRDGNYIWDGHSQSVEISGCKNEFVTFNLCVEAVEGLSNGKLSFGEFQHNKDGRELKMVFSSINRIWYVKDNAWMPEIPLPLQETFSIPSNDNKIKKQTNQSFLVELLIPRNASPGDYSGSLILTPEDSKIKEIPVKLTVWDFELPDTLSFNVELNAYDWRVCSPEYYRVAHSHRATLNALPYTQAGVVNPVTVPALKETGEIDGWATYDSTYGSLYDGSAFADLPRKNVPIPMQYLPMHENWPTNFHSNLNFLPQKTDFDEWVKEIALNAPPMEKIFSKKYVDSYGKITREFVDHFKEKKWNATEMQFYLNNKRIFNKGKMSWWILDEPMHIDDVLAIRYYSNLFKSGLTEKDESQFVFRIDISRPQFSRNLLTEKNNRMYVSQSFFTKNNLCQRIMRDGVKFIQYGTSNGIKASNLTSVLWPLRAFLFGADGILPWDSFGKDFCFTRPQTTGLLISAKPVGLDTVVASLRLKSMRRGEQDIEYLKLLQMKKGYNLLQIGKLVRDVLSLESTVETKDKLGFEDAGSIKFQNVNSRQLHELRCAIARALVE